VNGRLSRITDPMPLTFDVREISYPSDGSLAMPRAYDCSPRSDSIYSSGLDTSSRPGVRVLRTLVQASQAHAFCERLLGSLRHECLDFLALLGEEHLRQLLCAWKMHYNAGAFTRVSPGLPESRQASRTPDHRPSAPA